MFKKKDPVADLINEAMQTKGIERQLIEVRLIKAMTENLKWQFWQTIVSVSFGAILTFSLTYYTNDMQNDQSLLLLQLKLTDKQIEINNLNHLIEKHHSQKIQPNLPSKKTPKFSKAIAK